MGAGLSCLMATNMAFSALIETRLVGLAMHHETGRNIYIGALYYNEQVPRPDDIVTASGPKAMEYRVVARRTSIRSLMGNILLQAELATGKPPSAGTVEFTGKIMAAVKGSLYAGDSLEIRIRADNRTTAHLDGVELGRTNIREVSDYFLMGWVGARGPSTAFRSSILSTDIDSALLSAYRAHTISNERLATINSWNEPPKAAPPTAATPEATGIITAVLEAPVELAPLSVATEARKETSATTEVLAEITSAPVQSALSSAPEALAAATTTLLSEAPTLPPTEQVKPAEPVLLASLTPTREMVLPREKPFTSETVADTINVIDYSQKLSAFNTQVRLIVNSYLRYPKGAVRRGIQGTLELDLEVSMIGDIQDVVIARSSGHSTLDNSAIKAARKAFANTPFPDIVEVAVAEYSENGNTLIIPIPVSFILTK